MRIRGKIDRGIVPLDVGLSIGIEALDIMKVSRLGTSITFVDGISMGVSGKGLGLQRSLIFEFLYPREIEASSKGWMS